MTKRKTLSKKTRFEVFKRDAFCCQYCGKSAPDVILHVDHIKPVSKGGDSEIINLITACQECNAGKSDRELKDDTAIAKQRAQLEDLNKRREQLEMMLEWREGMAEIGESQIDAVESLLDDKVGHTLNDSGRTSVKKWLRKYPLSALLDALETSIDQYVTFNEDGSPNHASVGKAFGYTARICAVRERAKKEPYLERLYYIRGILRKRLSYVNEFESIKLMREYAQAGGDTEELEYFAKQVTNWTAFKNEITAFLEGEPA